MIWTTFENSIATVALARPEKKNALTPAMLADFNRAIGSVDSAARALLVHGEGDAFCSGFDLSLCLDNSDALRDLLTGLSVAIASLRNLPIPVVMAVHGAAIAGGCALLGGADIVITHAEAKLGYPVVKLGISPAVSMPFLMPAVGPAAARARALDSSLISGAEALRIGLAHECLPAGSASEVLPRAIAIAREVAAKPAAGVRATKAWLNELDGTGDPSRAANGLRTSLSLVGSAEERERLAELWKK
jgi:enoyl-CoA hydratase/carnithine racemase